MVSEAVVDALVAAVLAFGAPLLVVLFYAEGLVVGKLLQPPAVFIAYIAIATPTRPFLIAVCGACLFAATLGQWTLYRGFNEKAPELFGLRRQLPYLDGIPGRVQTQVGEKRLRFVERILDRYGVAGVCLTNAVPGIRCLIAVPAGLSDYPRGRYLVASSAGNLLYIALLVAVAFGAVELGGLIA